MERRRGIRRATGSSVGAADIELVAVMTVVALTVALGLTAIVRSGDTLAAGVDLQVCRIVNGAATAACPPGAPADDAVRLDATRSAPVPALVQAAAGDVAARTCPVTHEGRWEAGDETTGTGARNEYMTESGLCTAPDGTVEACTRDHVRHDDGAGTTSPVPSSGGGRWTCTPGPVPGVPAADATCESARAGVPRRCLRDGATSPEVCFSTVDAGGEVASHHCLPDEVAPTVVPKPADTTACTAVRAVDLQQQQECVVDGHPYSCDRVSPLVAPLLTWAMSWTCSLDPDATDAGDCTRAGSASTLCAVGDAWVTCLVVGTVTHCTQPGTRVDGELVPDVVYRDDCGAAVSFPGGDVAATGAGRPGAPIGVTDADLDAAFADLDAQLDAMAEVIGVATGFDVRDPTQAEALEAGFADLNGRMSSQRTDGSLSAAQPVVFGPDSPRLHASGRRTQSVCEDVAESLLIWGALPSIGSWFLLHRSQSPDDDLSAIGWFGLQTAAWVAPLMTAFNLLKLQRNRLAAARGGPVSLRTTLLESVHVLAATAGTAAQQAGTAIAGYWHEYTNRPGPAAATGFGDVELGEVQGALAEVQDEAVSGSTIPVPPPVTPVVAGAP